VHGHRNLSINYSLTPRSREGSSLNVREERLFHLRWLLDCVGPGASVSVDASWLGTAFGSEMATVVESATIFARECDCALLYDQATGVSTFERT
jgi:hypothetical protein